MVTISYTCFGFGDAKKPITNMMSTRSAAVNFNITYPAGTFETFSGAFVVGVWQNFVLIVLISKL